VPSGALAVGGIVAFTFGSLFLFSGDVPGFELSWAVVAGATVVSAALLLIALAAVWRSHRRGAVTGDTALVGSAGEAVQWRDGDGLVQVHGERWHATSAATLAKGQRVRILERKDLTLVIAPEPGVSPNP